MKISEIKGTRNIIKINLQVHVSIPAAPAPLPALGVEAHAHALMPGPLGGFQWERRRRMMTSCLRQAFQIQKHCQLPKGNVFAGKLKWAAQLPKREAHLAQPGRYSALN
jgi:hypothetical protein